MNYVMNEDESSTDEDVPGMLNMVLSIGEHHNSGSKHDDDTNLESIKFPSCRLHIDGLEVNTWVDTCAGYTIMGNKMFQKLWPGRTLFCTDIAPASYSGHRIPLRGFVWVDLKYGDNTVHGKMFIAEKGQMLLGWPHQARLGIKIDSSKNPPVYCVESGTQDYNHLEMEFPTVFTNKLGKLKGFKHKIVVREGVLPVKQKVRNVPINYRNKLKDILEDLCKKGIIEPIESSDWVSPIVISLKSNRELRLCVDLRSLNDAIWVDVYPLPNLQELTSTISDATVFSTIDLTSAYHQIELDVNSKHCTAFITPEGAFQYKRMPFGLASASAVFQRVMSKVIQGVPGTRVFQDDILIHGKDKLEHDERLRLVLHRLEENGLTVRRDKCKFGCAQVEYLGHLISGKGIQPKQCHVEAVRDAPSPGSKEQLMSFLGLTEFYSRFIDQYASKVEKLRELLKKNVKYEWSNEHELCFNKLKKEIINAPCLQPHIAGKRCIVSVDASCHGIGAVLSQTDGAEEWIVSYASRTLSSTERNYSVIEKELLAAVWASERFRMYVWGMKYKLRTDHKPLVNILKPGGGVNLTPRLARLAAKLQMYHFEIEYIPGRKNCIADGLSRLPLSACNEHLDVECEVALTMEDILCGNEYLGDMNVHLSEDMWMNAMHKDQDLIKVTEWLSKGWPEERNVRGELASYWKVKDELSYHNGLILRGERLVPPGTVRAVILQLGHSGHAGMSSTKRNIKQSFWWPGIDCEVDKFVRGCNICANSDKSAKPCTVPLTLVELPQGPWRKLAIDFIGPMSSPGGKEVYGIVLVDYYTKWPEIRIVSSVTTDTVINFLRRNICKGRNPVIISLR